MPFPAHDAASAPAVTLRIAFSSPREERFSILWGGAYAGGITVHSVDRAQKRFSYGIAIAPAMRRRGIASHALRQLFSLYASRGFTRCVAEVYASNAPSLALHRRLGFTPVEKSVDASARPLVRLELNLSPFTEE